ncbi:MAG: succinate dehydrogenase assembly factor 2 [Rhodocyclaceae bacterium]|jgi:antitoxin CptB|nr:succinate dehydrogenase assembly factor 2 [Rhodocyclaceae bacterium]
MDDATRARMGRLKWHCRRALLELDIVFQQFWAQHENGLDAPTETALTRLLALEDHDIWDLINGRAEIDDPELTELAESLRIHCVATPLEPR